ncbi:30S ribosomal protein S10 [Candidatus Peregrinibacteria bacterium]|nr:MAG: 30S ribosomal protein S10 [Candidatus Peregrinibacteria bacterium]
MAAKKAAAAAEQRIRITLKAFDHTIIDKAVRVIIETAERTGAIVAGPIPLPTKIKRFTVLKSTFVSKNSREQFEMRIHKRLIDLREITASTMEALSNLSLPAGVDIEIKMMAA